MIQRTPYNVDSKIRLRGSQMFVVDPNVTNEGTIPAVPGSIINYQYKLPFLAHNFPVRRIRLLGPEQLVLTPANNALNVVFLTLRKADGTYLLDRVPANTFLDAVGGRGNQARPILFDRDFYPDPRMSFAQWTTGGLTARMALEFHYG